ncbi:SPOR domain-containing protein [Legionella sp. 27cVA30]|uniref:SPOR domain-containing protein n=1 Tax=Legionella TaxID=445 RepID=UPI000F8F0A1C|nr:MULTISPECIES: SPOR domain-containing protein [Legionella]MCP0913083.1 SPOR domain-containing protein [Legionella sp. 27cVA30]RUR13785.1 SPOR domain-containing protein [Legionella septentrionalis]
MFKHLSILKLAVCSAALSGCVSYNPNGYTNYQTYTFEGTPVYPESYEDTYTRPQAQVSERKQVEVPDSYHVGAFHSPASHKDRDRDWVASQNPQGYTIELADDEKASLVAGKLVKAPKKNRMATVKYERGGRNYYKGLYGTYPSYEEAQEALNALPEDMKQGAQVKNWGSIQQVNE